MTARPVTERIANLGVEVRWAEKPPHRWNAVGVRPLFGPFAGRQVTVRATTIGGGRGWYLRLWSSADRATVDMAPEADHGKPWRSASEAKAGAVRLLHGDTGGLVWHPTSEASANPGGPSAPRGWRPMGDLPGWLEGR